MGKGYYAKLPSRTEEALICSQMGSAIGNDLGVWNDYGLTTNDFVYCYENGIFKERLDEKEYESIPWDKMEANDPTFVKDIMTRIAYKQGKLGELWADGPYHLESVWPEIAEAHNKEHDLGCWKMGHRYHHSTENCGQIGALINMMYNRDPMGHSQVQMFGSGLPYELQTEIIDELLGISGASDKSREYTPMNEAKAAATKLCLVNLELHNSLTLCNYTLPVWFSPLKSRNYRGDAAMEAKLYSAVTGDQMSREELDEVGLRIFTLFRALTARYMNERDMRNKHDLANDWVFDYPEDKEPFTAGHSRMDRDDMELAKDLFYPLLGWDKTTGMPTRATLEKLNLRDVADDLAQRNLLPA